MPFFVAHDVRAVPVQDAALGKFRSVLKFMNSGKNLAESIVAVRKMAAGTYSSECFEAETASAMPNRKYRGFLMNRKTIISLLFVTVLPGCSENAPPVVATSELPDMQNLTAEEIATARRVSDAVLFAAGRDDDAGGTHVLLANMAELRKAVAARKAIILAGHSGSVAIVKDPPGSEPAFSPVVQEKLDSNSALMRQVLAAARESVAIVDPAAAVPGMASSEARTRIHQSLDRIEAAIDEVVPHRGTEAFALLVELEAQISSARPIKSDPALTTPTIAVSTTHK